MYNEYSHKNPRQRGDLGCSVDKALATSAQDLNLIPTTHEKASCAPCTCNSCIYLQPLQETGGPLGLSSKPSSRLCCAMGLLHWIPLHPNFLSFDKNLLSSLPVPEYHFIISCGFQFSDSLCK